MGLDHPFPMGQHKSGLGFIQIWVNLQVTYIMECSITLPSSMLNARLVSESWDLNIYIYIFPHLSLSCVCSDSCFAL